MHNWTVQETRQGVELALEIYHNGESVGVADITLYGNGPCLKCLTLMDTNQGTSCVKAIVKYMELHHSHRDGMFAYVYDYFPQGAKFLLDAGFEYFRDIDCGRTVYRRDLPQTIVGKLSGFVNDLGQYSRS